MATSTDRPQSTVAQINFEAGTHAVPDDPGELAAALRAGERSWARFPYYAARYGERGRRFTRSDSAWLATIVGHDVPVVEQRVLWLGGVLASRGMPQWLLELHLEVLHDELCAEAPARRDRYATLLAGARVLRALRERHLGPEVLAAHTNAFAARVGPEWDARLPETGGLIAAAVADEAAGIARAVTSLVPWLSEPSRFPAHWIAAVEETLTEARLQAEASTRTSLHRGRTQTSSASRRDPPRA